MKKINRHTKHKRKNDSIQLMSTMARKQQESSRWFPTSRITKSSKWRPRNGIPMKMMLLTHIVVFSFFDFEYHGCVAKISKNLSQNFHNQVLKGILARSWIVNSARMSFVNLVEQPGFLTKIILSAGLKDLNSSDHVSWITRKYSRY